MPLVPTLPAPAAPNMAEAYGQGARTRLGLLGIRQQAQEAAQRTQLGYAQIAAQQQEAQMRHQAAQMELQGKQALAQQELLRQQHEMEMTNAYRTAQLGLEKQNFDRMQSETAMKLKEAAANEAIMSETRKAIEEADKYAVPEYRKTLYDEAEDRQRILSGKGTARSEGVPRYAASSMEQVAEPEGYIFRGEGNTGAQFIPKREPSAGTNRGLSIQKDALDAELAIVNREIVDLDKAVRGREDYYGEGFKPKNDIEKRQVAALKADREALKVKTAERATLIKEIKDLAKEAESTGRMPAPTMDPGGSPYSGTNAPRRTVTVEPLK